MKRSILLCLAAVAAMVVGFAPGPAAAGGGCHSPEPTEGNGQTVHLSRNCMSPTVLKAEEGGITFVNDDPGLHNVTGSGMFEELASGATFTRRFASGTYPFSCTLHPGMNGVLIVGDGDSEGTRAEPAPVTPIAASPASAESPASESTNGLLTIAVALVVAVIAATGGFAFGRRRPS